MAYICTVRVTKFDEHNEKAIGKRMLWHRMDATIWGRHEFVATTPQTKLTWWWLLSQACMTPARECTITARVMHDLGARTTRQLHESITRLESLGWIQVLSVSDAPASFPLRTNERYERTNEVLLPAVVVPTSPPVRRAAPLSTYRVIEEQDLVTVIDGDVWQKWGELYDREYVRREVTKSVIWLKANPKKAKKTPRGWIQFMANWLERGWDRSTTRGPSQQPATTSWTSVAERILAALSKGSPDEKRALLGDETYELACKVGWHNIGQMQRSEFTARNLAGQLKAQFELQAAK